jgi:hypothetical protein
MKEIKGGDQDDNSRALKSRFQLSTYVLVSLLSVDSRISSIWISRRCHYFHLCV